MNELKKQGDIISPKQTVAFERVIDRLQSIVDCNTMLTNKAFDKSCRIANTQRSADEIGESKGDNSIISTLHSVMDKLENSNSVLQLVVEDLENAIP